jgi:molybdopterin molybdotransferase
MLTGAKRAQHFAGCTGIEEALAWIDAHLAPLPAENVPLAEAANRIVAVEMRATRDLPPLDRAAIDGFALRAEETVGASTYNTLPFRLMFAGRELPANSAARVSAGDQMPSGANAVVAREHMTEDAQTVGAIAEPVVLGAGVECIGSHLRRGSTITSPGRRLRADDVGMLAAAGVTQVPVIRRPHMCCVLTGSTAFEAERLLSVGAFHDADGPMLRALAERDGAMLSELRWVDRDVLAIRDALTSSRADIVLVIGSSGRGPEDHAAAALAQAGELVIHGVALRPADTIGMGLTAAGVPVFLLPGAPAACLWGYEIVAGRAVRRLGGRSPALPFASRKMTSARKIVSEIGMMEVCPVRCCQDGTVAPLPSFAEAGLMSAMRADGFVLVPAGSEGHPQDATVLVYLFDDGRAQ